MHLKWNEVQLNHGTLIIITLMMEPAVKMIVVVLMMKDK